MPRKKRREHHHIYHHTTRHNQDARIALPGTADSKVIAATPTTLAAVLAAANAGEVIELAEGTYAATWQVSTANLTIRNRAGTHPVIDGGLILNNPGIVIRGLEILNSSWVGRASVASIPFGVEVTAQAPNAKVQNCLIHDTDAAIITAADGLEVTGCVIWNIGVSASEHGIYINNNVTPALIRDNVLMPAYGYGLHAYSDAGGSANNITFDHNVMVACPNVQFAQGIISEGVVASNNEGYAATLWIGQASQNNADATITGNYLVYSRGGTVLDVRRWNSPTVTGNTIIGDADDKLINFVPATNAPMVWDNNTYIRLNATATKFASDDGTALTFEGWKATYAARNADANSTEGTTLPTTNRIVIRQNPYDFDRAWVAAYNWENRASIEIDLSGLGLTYGARYVLRQAQDPLNDVQGFVFHGSTVNVSMAGHTVATPTGAVVAIVASTFPLFGCWLLEKA